MAVEWLRTARTGTWRLFQNDPVLTEGIYFRVNSKTPFYEEGTWLWSKYWVSDFMDEDPPLGEVNATTAWDTGAPPPFPLAEVRVGSSSCCGDGAIYPAQLLDFNHNVEGLPDSCLEPPPGYIYDPSPDWCDPENAAMSAQLLSKLSAGEVIPEAFITSWLGPMNAIESIPPGNTWMPGWCIADGPNYTAVWMSGSDNLYQILTQGGQYFLPPDTVTGLPTYGLWLQAAKQMLYWIDTLRTGSNTKPYFLCGHSYGGVVATILADMYRRGDPGRGLSVCAFGVPKCVSPGLAIKNKRERWCFWANEGDPIPDLPPGIFQLGPLTLIVPLPIKLVWLTWAKPGRQIILRGAGLFEESQGSTYYFFDLEAIVVSLVTGAPIATFVPHEIESYLARLQGGP